MASAETIYALSSGAPPAAIGIVRLSGPGAFAIAEALAGTLPEPRHAALRALHDPRDGTLLDRALVLCFPAPRTATGEDVVELHVHGGRSVVAAVESAIAAISGTRRAAPGEFTRRALENGVIDLTEAEGLGDLLSAQTETQRRAALRMAEGGVRFLVENWRGRLVTLAAVIEAQLDFSDTDDVGTESTQHIHADLGELSDEIAKLVEVPSVERLHDGIRVVIAGPPNSGKSTLLNALTGRDVAIVSPVSGTTRDRIEAPVIRSGVVYLLTDTAGLTDRPSDAVEAIGIDRANAAIAAADIVLWLGDHARAASDTDIIVHSKADLGLPLELAAADIGISVSGLTGYGVDALWTAIHARAATLLPAEDAYAVNLRQRDLLGCCCEHLRSTESSSDLLIIAEEIRLAMRSLDAVVGRTGVEHVLDAIFSNFCIGK